MSDIISRAREVVPFMDAHDQIRVTALINHAERLETELAALKTPKTRTVTIVDPEPDEQDAA